MWFFDISDKLWHKSSGAVGKPALCGRRWGGGVVDSTLYEPDYGEKCPECVKGKTNKRELVSA